MFVFVDKCSKLASVLDDTVGWVTGRVSDEFGL